MFLCSRGIRVCPVTDLRIFLDLARVRPQLARDAMEKNALGPNVLQGSGRKR